MGVLETRCKAALKFLPLLFWKPETSMRRTSIGSKLRLRGSAMPANLPVKYSCMRETRGDLQNAYPVNPKKHQK